jgi:hypothetical protein
MFHVFQRIVDNRGQRHVAPPPPLIEGAPNSLPVFNLRPTFPRLLQLKPTVPLLLKVIPTVPRLLKVSPTIPRLLKERPTVPRLFKVRPIFPSLLEVRPKVRRFFKVRSTVPRVYLKTDETFVSKEWSRSKLPATVRESFIRVRYLEQNGVLWECRKLY